MLTQKAIRYSMNTYPVCDSPLRDFRDRRKQRLFVTEIALKLPFLSVDGNTIRYGFRAGATAQVGT